MEKLAPGSITPYLIPNFNLSSLLIHAMKRNGDEEPQSDISSVLSSPPPSPNPCVVSPTHDDADVPHMDLDLGDGSKLKTGPKARSKKN
ncbi:hypothetical protein PM082_009190 [Marasmius tenuissimus]|nr:hypothetical protein PM082_009190 [Marasmius tenuissimus]